MSTVVNVSASVTLDPAGMQRFFNNPSVSENDKKRECARQFEAIMVSKMIEEGLKPQVKGCIEEDSIAQDMHRSFLAMELGNAISRQGSFNIGHSIYNQINA